MFYTLCYTDNSDHTQHPCICANIEAVIEIVKEVGKNSNLDLLSISKHDDKDMEYYANNRHYI